MGYFRLLQRIMEQPDIGTKGGRLALYLRQRSGLESAIVMFSALTLARSRKHRVLLAFYWGAGATLVFVVTHPTITALFRKALLFCGANSRSVRPTSVSERRFHTMEYSRRENGMYR